MNWSTGLGVIALLLSALSLIRAYRQDSTSAGKDAGASEQRFLMIDETLKRHALQHTDHYQHAKDDQAHFQDTEMHWTGRERDALARVLEDMAKDLKELLKQGRSAKA